MQLLDHCDILLMTITGSLWYSVIDNYWLTVIFCYWQLLDHCDILLLAITGSLWYFVINNYWITVTFHYWQLLDHCDILLLTITGSLWHFVIDNYWITVTFCYWHCPWLRLSCVIMSCLILGAIKEEFGQHVSYSFLYFYLQICKQQSWGRSPESGASMTIRIQVQASYVC